MQKTGAFFGFLFYYNYWLLDSPLERFGIFSNHVRARIGPIAISFASLSSYRCFDPLAHLYKFGQRACLHPVHDIPAVQLYRDLTQI